MANKERKVKKVQARHILVGNKELAEKIKKKIDDGEEFSKLAEESAVAKEVDLSLIGLKRNLTEFQKDNIYKLIRMPNGSNFSVPGAGKTATTLCVYAYLRSIKKVQRLIVVSPNSAFSS